MIRQHLNIIKCLIMQWVLACLPLMLWADVKLPALVSNGMVLQRDTRVHLWGWASPGERILIRFNGKNVNTTASSHSRWDAYLSPIPAGGPYEMVVKGNNTIKISNILFGDVWLCSGQSNMEYQLYKSAYLYPADVAAAGKYPIREFTVKNPYKFEPQTDAIGSWKQADPKAVLNFSAVAYFFAQSLYHKYHVPIGILHASFPGSPAEAWVSEEGLKDFKYYIDKANVYKNTPFADSVLNHDKQVNSQWLSKVQKNDAGLLNGSQWKDGKDSVGWKPMTIPGCWERYGAADVDGVVWLKRMIKVPAEMLKGKSTLELGLIADIDSTYINGHLVGAKDNKYLVRRYDIPQGILHAGTNTIVIRVVNKADEGGIIPGKQYRLSSGNKEIDLSGRWLYKVGYASEALPVKTFTRMEFMPAIQYQSRIVPVTGYTIKGACWYQGESNVNKANEYHKLLPALIADWRSKWQQGNFPFLIVQLANYADPAAKPGTNNWALLREAQFKVAQTTPACALAITIDKGEANDIHPPDKKTVGNRLALAAQSVAYGDKKVIFSGPTFKSLQTQGQKAIVYFNSIGGGLAVKGEKLRQFAVAGTDKVFHQAQADIKGQQIEVWSPDVPKPVAVRYAWANNPQGCNLYNSAGLPAVPFRTDNWEQ